MPDGYTSLGVGGCGTKKDQGEENYPYGRSFKIVAFHGYGYVWFIDLIRSVLVQKIKCGRNVLKIN